MTMRTSWPRCSVLVTSVIRGVYSSNCDSDLINVCPLCPTLLIKSDILRGPRSARRRNPMVALSRVRARFYLQHQIGCGDEDRVRC